MIRGLCESKRTDDATKVVGHMRNSKVRPTDVSFTTLIRECCESKTDGIIVCSIWR